MRNGWIKEDDYEYHLVNNVLHNEDGPAILWRDGAGSYYLEGSFYPRILSDLEWLLIVKKWKEANNV
jgi:hypothetical protein